MRPTTHGLLPLLLLPLLACGEQVVGWPLHQAPPSVIWTTPERGERGVALDATLLATFSRAMDPETLTDGVMTLTDGATEIDGELSPIGTEGLLFSPPELLQADTEYTATITTAAQDLAGEALLNDYTWRFTTRAQRLDTGEQDSGDTGDPPWALLPVPLGSLQRFVVVAGAGLTNSNSGGLTILGGDVALSPTGSCLGDGEPCSASNPIIDGALFANDAEGVAALAKADLTAAYTDAMSRPPGATVSDLSGLTLPPGVYTSSSSMSVAVDGVVTLDAVGDENAVWIFQIGSSLTVNNGARVELINGARAENVYWAAFASTTLGADVVFQGNVLAGASNSVGTRSVVLGRLLCTEGAVTLLSNVITRPAS